MKVFLKYLRSPALLKAAENGVSLNRLASAKLSE
jgi:hypothetical protein